MIGFGENIGSGFPLILSAWGEKHWLRPELIERPELLQVKLTLSIENKKDEGLVEKLVERAKVNGDDLSERRIAILRLIMENPKISISKMAEELQVSSTSIDKHLEYLRKRYIRRVGGDKGGHWEIILQ